MTKWIETTGRTEEDAISAALLQLGLERDDVSVEVLERAKPGFLGLGVKPAKVRVTYEADDNGIPMGKHSNSDQPGMDTILIEEESVTVLEEDLETAELSGLTDAPEEITSNDPAPFAPPKEPMESNQTIPAESAEADDDRIARIQTFLSGLMERMDVKATPEITPLPEGGYQVVLRGHGLGAVIGRRGETLDAIQHLTNYAVNRGYPKRVRIYIDAEHYRAKREESLRRLAEKTAGKVVHSRRNITLEPMNAYERHVIHTALQAYPGVTTYSTGVEPNRRTVVAYDLNRT